MVITPQVITTTLTNEINLYKQNNITVIDDNWINLISNKLSINFSNINNYYLLYDEDTSLNIFKNIISRNLFNLITNFVNYTNYIRNDWTDLTNYKDTNDNTNQTKTGYSGFDMSNQDGNYNIISQTGQNTQQNKLAYMNFFNTQLEEWGQFLVKTIKNEMLLLIF